MDLKGIRVRLLTAGRAGNRAAPAPFSECPATEPRCSWTGPSAFKAAGEHASVASFARVALDLLALGAGGERARRALEARLEGLVCGEREGAGGAPRAGAELHEALRARLLADLVVPCARALLEAA